MRVTEAARYIGREQKYEEELAEDIMKILSGGGGAEECTAGNRLTRRTEKAR